MTRSVGEASSSRYLRAMAIAFIAWLMAAGPVATTAGGWLRADSRTTLQIAPATELGLESPFTLSTGLSDAATSRTSELAMWSSPDTLPFFGRAYGADRLDERVEEARGAAPPAPRAGRPPRAPGALPFSLLLIRSSRDISTPLMLSSDFV